MQWERGLRQFALTSILAFSAAIAPTHNASECNGRIKLTGYPIEGKEFPIAVCTNANHRVIVQGIDTNPLMLPEGIRQENVYSFDQDYVSYIKVDGNTLEFHKVNLINGETVQKRVFTLPLSLANF